VSAPVWGAIYSFMQGAGASARTPAGLPQSQPSLAVNGTLPLVQEIGLSPKVPARLSSK